MPLYGSFPSELDWRNVSNQDYVTPIRAQANCGSCWAFASVGALESKINIQLNNSSYDANLSEQQLVSCSPAGTCAGGYITSTLEYANQTGIAKEACMPYNASDMACTIASICPSWQNHTLRSSSFQVASNESAIKQAISDYGPVIIGMYVYSDFFSYGSGVYSHVSGNGSGYHAVVIVGYNDTGEYWICKNSWGTVWGEQGFFRISYAENSLEWIPPSSEGVFFLDTVYGIYSTDISLAPVLSGAQASASFANSSANVTFSLYAYPKSIKNLSFVKLNSTAMQGSLSEGGAFSLSAPLSAFGCSGFEGQCLLYANATDDAGISATLAMPSIIVDDIAPSVQIISPASGAYNTAQTINVSANDTYLDTIAIHVNGVAVQNCSSSPCTYALSAEGNYSFYATANDTAGNMNTTETRNATIYTAAPRIFRAWLSEPDNFYSPYPENSIAHLLLNATDGAGGQVNLSTSHANFSNLTSDCGNGSAIAYFSQNGSLLQAQCNLSSAAAQSSFVGGQISITVFDNSGNFNQTSVAPVILYNMTTPPSGSACLRFGEDSTNLSRELNFSSVNFAASIEINGSPGCNGGAALPWEGFSKALLLNFTSLNLSDQATAQKLSQLSQAINASIAPPRSFGQSRIYVNSSFIAAFNTTANITFFNLPFASEPGILSDAGAAGVNFSAGSVAWSQGEFDPSYNTTIGNLSFMVLGFSGYNVSDNRTPSASIFSPIAGLNTSVSSIEINLSANGTGSEISFLSINITSSASCGSTYNYTFYSNATNTANCTVLSPGSEAVNCHLSVPLLSDGYYAINVTALDYGGNSGNRYSAQQSFRLDTAAPAISISSPANNSTTTNRNVSFSWSATDILGATCNLTIDGMVNRSGIEDENHSGGGGSNGGGGGCGSSGPLPLFFNAYATSNFSDGVHNWSVSCWDSINNTNTSETRFFTLDTTAPAISISLPGGSNLSSNAGIALNFTVFDAHSGVNESSCMYSINGGANISVPSCANTTFNASVSDGQVNLTLYASDMAGNANSSGISFIVDMVAPTVAIRLPDANSISPANSTPLNFTAYDGNTGVNSSSCQYRLNGAVPVNLSSCENVSAINLADGVNTIIVHANDNVGNQGNATAYVLYNSPNNTLLLNESTVVTGNQSILVMPASPSANITLGANATNASLNMSSVGSNTSATVTVNITNQVNLSANTSLGIIQLWLPGNLSIIGNSTWDGTLYLPSVRESAGALPTNSGTNSVNGVVAIGFADVQLNFTKAVRILIPGKAESRAGYVRAGAFTEITAACANDSQADSLADGADCKIASGSDLAVWTRHFTEFVTYTNTPASGGSTPGGSNGGGGGGGGSGSSSIKQSSVYMVDMGKGAFCPVTITREIKSAASLSVLTTTLENSGEANCSMEYFVFVDAIPQNFPEISNLTFVPGYDSLNGSNVTYSFPSFASGESKTISYSAQTWIPTSRAKNFTEYSMAAKKRETSPAGETQPTQAQPGGEQPEQNAATPSQTATPPQKEPSTPPEKKAPTVIYGAPDNTWQFVLAALAVAFAAALAVNHIVNRGGKPGVPPQPKAQQQPLTS